MPNPSVDLSSFSNLAFERGTALWKEFCWIVVSALIFRHSLSLWNGIKVGCLRAFGASIGRKVIIKPGVQIKFPWKLRVGDHSWIGENVWIDNLDYVKIGSNACISQGSYIFTGNHDYKKTTFDLIVKPVTIENGAWVGAKAIVCPGVTIATHAVVTAGSVATGDIQAYGIYQGNPAVFVRTRLIS